MLSFGPYESDHWEEPSSFEPAVKSVARIRCFCKPGLYDQDFTDDPVASTSPRRRRELLPIYKVEMSELVGQAFSISFY
jgi:hypothetical protein